MTAFKAQIQAIQDEWHTALQAVHTQQDLEQLRIQFLGRKGKIAALTEQFKQLPVEEKRLAGPLLQELKQTVQQTHEKKENNLKQTKRQQAQQKQRTFDVTAYRQPIARGSLHIYTHIIEQLEDVFTSMGYTIIDGPEVETSYYNFEALNIPADHPARDSHDTFWLTTPGMLMRTHTSSVQAHAMEQQRPPIAVFAPGRCYRNEATDATHDFLFTQAEGLLIDKNISLAHLLDTARTFLQAIFEKKDLKIRVRPGYFPFVEPGVEIDASCPFCNKGCSICKKTTWIELLGAGLVHPNVLRCNGIDPDVYSGFAFGFGIERIAMIKYGIGDIRLFHSNTIPFLNQF